MDTKKPTVATVGARKPPECHECTARAKFFDDRTLSFLCDHHLLKTKHPLYCQDCKGKPPNGQIYVDVRGRHLCVWCYTRVLRRAFREIMLRQDEGQAENQDEDHA